MGPVKVFDLHCDTIDALSMRDVPPYSALGLGAEQDLASNTLQLALGRMRQAGSWVQCFAVWVPDDLSAFPGGPLSFYHRARDYFKAQMARHAGLVTQVRDARDVDGVLAEGRIAAMLTVENGSPIGNDLGVVDEWEADGVKMVTLTWNGPNTIASGHDTTQGLSSFGRQVVRALEDRRMVVDVSHLNDVGFWDLMKVVRRPIAASHSNLRAICGHRRNLTDDQFRAIMDTGGIVGLNYYCDFLKDGAPRPDEVSFDDLSAHLERFLDLGGEGSIALGSDFDGSTTPAWLASCDDLPALFERVAARFGQELAQKLFFDNARAFFVRNETA